MTDKDKPTADAKPVKESKAGKPASSVAAPAGDPDTAAGTDQHGRKLYNVDCAACGKQAQVPFKPSGDRPVYCRDCYMQQRSGMGKGTSRGPRK